MNAWRGGSWGPYIALRDEAWTLDQTDLRYGSDASQESVEEASRGRWETAPWAHRSAMWAHRSVGPSGPTGRAAPWCLLVSSGSFFCRFRCKIDISSSGTPNIANDMSVSIVSTSSMQWCTLIHHLRHFYMVKTGMSYKTSELTKTRGTC